MLHLRSPMMIAVWCTSKLAGVVRAAVRAVVVVRAAVRAVVVVRAAVRTVVVVRAAVRPVVRAVVAAAREAVHVLQVVVHQAAVPQVVPALPGVGQQVVLELNPRGANGPHDSVQHLLDERASGHVDVRNALTCRTGAAAVSGQWRPACGRPGSRNPVAFGVCSALHGMQAASYSMCVRAESESLTRSSAN